MQNQLSKHLLGPFNLKDKMIITVIINTPNSTLCIFFNLKVNECEATRNLCIFIFSQKYTINFAEWFEQLLQICLGRLLWQISHANSKVILKTNHERVVRSNWKIKYLQVIFLPLLLPNAPPLPESNLLPNLLLVEAPARIDGGRYADLLPAAVCAAVAGATSLASILSLSISLRGHLALQWSPLQNRHLIIGIGAEAVSVFSVSFFQMFLLSLNLSLIFFVIFYWPCYLFVR